MAAPTAVARAGVELAVRALPELDDRLRYRAEFRADLHELPPVAQLRYAAGVLSRTYALRAALGSTPTRAEEAAMTAPTTRRPHSLRCRVLHMHDWVPRSTEDGERYTACARCERIKEEFPPRSPGAGSAAGSDDWARFVGLFGSGGAV